MSHLRTVVPARPATITRLAAAAGWDDDRTPLVCTCPTPRPEPVLLFGHIVVAGAYECARCRRPTHLRSEDT
jgi:hypothetical protein